LKQKKSKTMNYRLRVSALLPTTALSLGLAGPTLAENVGGQPADASQSGLEEIIVTARRKAERLQDVPISITVFDQKQLEDRNVTDAADLAKYTPSLSSDQRFGGEIATFSIRGFTQELHTASSVAVYFADVVAPRGGGATLAGGDGASPGEFFDLQNVQVLKGPQGTLFGRNTTGGAVLLVPQKPTGQFEGYAEGSFGNYDMKRGQAVVNLPVNDNVRVRLGVDRQVRDGYEKNISGVGPSRFADVDYTAARASIVIDITPNLENYTIGTYSRSDTNGTLEQVYACNPTQAFGSFACADLARQGSDFYNVQNSLDNPESSVKQWQVINHTTWQATDNLTIKNIASYGELRQSLRQEVFGTRFLVPDVVPGFGGTRILTTQASPLPGLNLNDQSTLTEELQFQGLAFDSRLAWQGGAYFERSVTLPQVTGSRTADFIACSNINNLACTDILGIFGGAPGAVGLVQDQSASLNYRNLAAYGQTTYTLTEKLKLTTGLRYTSDKSDGVGYVVLHRFPNPTDPTFHVDSCGYPGGLLADGCAISSATKSHAPTWLIDLDYTPIENVLTYGKYTRGYRQGAANPISPPGFDTFGPEKVDSYEIGLKTSFHGAVSGTFNMALFYNDLKNQQLQVGLLSSTQQAAQTSAILNAGESRIEGLEVESSLIPARWFRTDLSYAYLDTKLLSQSTALPTGGVYDTVVYTAQSGTQLPFTPKHKLTLTGTVTLPVPASLGTVAWSTSYNYSSNYLVQAPAVGYTYGNVGKSHVVNMNLNWSAIGGGPVDASLFVTNLTQDKYATYTNGLYNTPFALEARSLSEPRMFGLRVRMNFGRTR
jgi:iron complex outermembrane receptor protein